MINDSYKQLWKKKHCSELPDNQCKTVQNII